MTRPAAPAGAAPWTTTRRSSILCAGRRNATVPGDRRAHNPNNEDTNMAKGIEPKKDPKKKPAKTMKEKRAEKKAKKDAKR